MYNRNFIYISNENQKVIKNTHVLIAGCGLGSVIAECALRLGFECISIIDGDRVEYSNLNRQNYIAKDIGKYKADALRERLLAINPKAQVHAFHNYITEGNLGTIMKQYSCQIAINTIDFDSAIPFIFDSVCRKLSIPVLHPLNLGWGGSVIVISPSGDELSDLTSEYQDFDLRMVEYIFSKLSNNCIAPSFLRQAIEDYKSIRSGVGSPPQLSVGSWVVASMCTTLLYKMSVNLSVNTFPEIYFSTVM